jgi:hypothetical protein
LERATLKRVLENEDGMNGPIRTEMAPTVKELEYTLIMKIIKLGGSCELAKYLRTNKSQRLTN